jgi:hypothetical protein
MTALPISVPDEGTFGGYKAKGTTCVLHVRPS